MSTNLPKEFSTVIKRQTEFDYFDRYYRRDSTVDSSKFDAVVSYFDSRTEDISAAKALASTLFEISKSTDIEPMTILDDFKNYEENEGLQAALLGLINNTRQNTSKLGYAPARNPAPNVVRNIRV